MFVTSKASAPTFVVALIANFVRACGATASTQSVGWLAALALAFSSLAVSVSAQTTNWGAAASMSTARHKHTATLLPSGKVLVASGGGGAGFYSTSAFTSAELYDPASNNWTPAGSLAAARNFHTATLLPSGKVLVAGGSDSSGGALNSAELYDPVSNSWAAAGSMGGARYYHTAILLPSGKVLVAGGGGVSGVSLSVLNSAELYDPASNSWTPTGSLGTARYVDTATLLPSGKVLVAGGYNSSSGPLASAELYDPASNSWTPTGSLGIARYVHTATLLPSGKVLVAGGRNNSVVNSGVVNSAELYDPASNSWTAAGPLGAARVNHTATLLPSGKVLVAGGIGSFGLFTNGFPNGAELYDPASNSWTPAGPLGAARYLHTATLLPSGKVLVVGGYDSSNDVSLNSAELYDPASSIWTAAGSLGAVRYAHVATLLPSGKSLVAGGQDNNDNPLTSAELYDSASNSWTSTGSLGAARNNFTATLLPSGKVLVAGGQGINAGALTSAELYDPASNSWTPAGPLGAARYVHTATLLPSGKVLVSGGTSDGTVGLNSAELYDPASNSWTPAGPVGAARYFHTATLLPSGKVLVAGGTNSGVVLASAELYDPGSNSWTPAGPLGTARNGHTATLLPSGKVLVAGGSNKVAVLTSAELYDPGSNSWTPAGLLGAARFQHTATLLPSGNVLVAGGYDSSGGALGSAELYGSASKVWTTAGTLSAARGYHTATLLPSGKVLVAGGQNSSIINSAELNLYDLGIDDTRRPVIASVNSPLTFGSAVTLTGTGFTGDSEASGGSTNSSATNVPLLQLRRIDNEQIVWTSPAMLSTRSTTGYQSLALTGLPVGPYLLTVYVNALASSSKVVFAVKANQSISGFTPTTPVVFGAAAQTLTATAGASSSPLVFSVISGPCTISGATLSYTGAGSCLVAVNQAADADYNAAAQVTQSITVTQATSTTALAASSTATVFGQSVTFTASTTSNNANRSGTVAFTNSGTTLSGCAAVALTGNCLISSFSVGSHAITATYSGDANTLGSANATPVNVTVSKASTAVSLTPPTAINLGNAATIVVSVAVQSPGAGSLTGTVLVTDGTVTCSFVLPATSCNLTPTSAGMKTLTITYTPDVAATPNFTASSGRGSLLVNPSAPGSTLGSSANPNVYGQSLTLTATVTAAAGGQRATGTVAFTDGSNSIAGCTAQPLTAGGSAASANATCVIAAANSLTAGTHALSVSYTGDSNNTASSASLSQSITLANQTIAFGSPPTLVYQGSAALTATGGASGNAVIFSSTTPSVCTVNGVTVTDVTAGSCIVAANQAGNGNYSAAPQVTQSLVVARVTSQSTLSSSPTPPSPRQALTLLHTVTQIGAGAVVPTGTVTFSDNGVVLATVALDSNGQARYIIAALSSGSHSFTATYSGDSIVAPSSALMVLDVAAQIVPTLSGWMLLLLALLLGAAALRTQAIRVRLQR